MDPNETLKNMEENSEMNLLQNEKIISSIDGLEPAMEGILIKTAEGNETLKKIAEALEPQTIGDNATFTIKGLKGDTPTDEKLVSLIQPLIPAPIPGKDADEEKMIKEILSKIPKPKDGRNPLTISKTMPKNPQMGDLWYKN